MDPLEASELAAQIERLITQQRLHSSLIASAIMLGLGVEETRIPQTMSRLENNAIATSPAAVYDQIKLAILAQDRLPFGDQLGAA